MKKASTGVIKIKNNRDKYLNRLIRSFGLTVVFAIISSLQYCIAFLMEVGVHTVKTKQKKNFMNFFKNIIQIRYFNSKQSFVKIH